MSVDPVCGMQVDESKAAGKTVYRDEVFYFCSLRCKQRFEEDPEAFIGE